MIPGFNENVLHNGKLYHIQTEDAEPKIVTHLFLCGNILATLQVSYADIVGSEHIEKVIKEIMIEQHKTMIANLKNGTFDKTKKEIVIERETNDTKTLDEVILDYLIGDFEDE